MLAEYLAVIHVYQRLISCCCARFRHQDENKSTSYLFMITPRADDNEVEDMDEAQKQLSSIRRSIDEKFAAIE